MKFVYHATFDPSYQFGFNLYRASIGKDSVKFLYDNDPAEGSEQVGVEYKTDSFSIRTGIVVVVKEEITYFSYIFRVEGDSSRLSKDVFASYLLSLYVIHFGYIIDDAFAINSEFQDYVETDEFAKQLDEWIEIKQVYEKLSKE